MSYSLVSSFVAAIRNDQDLLARLRARAKRIANGQSNQDQGERLFVVARPSQDEQEDLLPYIIVTPDNLTSDSSKDWYEDGDTVTVSLLLVETTFRQLVTLMDTVRHDISLYLPTDAVNVTSYNLTAGAVQYDPEKPCYYTTLTYTCQLA